MGKVETYKGVISSFISSEKGQRFFNFAYSIGAAIVIWGALFKILHLPGGNMLLSIGMGTEVMMFVLTAFDRPPKEYKWEDVFPALRGEEDAEVRGGLGGVGGGTVVVGDAQQGTHAGAGLPVDVNAADMQSFTSSARQCLDEMSALAEEMRQLHTTTSALNQVSATLLDSYRAITENSEGISRSSAGYVEQMTALHQNLGGLNTIYELQLRSVSSQIDAIDRVNRGIKDIRDMYEKSANQSARYCEETEKMARYMQQLNSIYERMIQAMTVNMYRPAAMPDLGGIGINGDAAHNGAMHTAPAEQQANV